jgi:hypothetical protein
VGKETFVCDQNKLWAGDLECTAVSCPAKIPTCGVGGAAPPSCQPAGDVTILTSKFARFHQN